MWAHLGHNEVRFLQHTIAGDLNHANLLLEVAEIPNVVGMQPADLRTAAAGE